jgi:hypothetical protein
MLSLQSTWNLGTNSAFTLGPKKTKENLDRVGRSQNLPDANLLLASSSALNTRALALVPICAGFFLSFFFLFFFFFPHKLFTAIYMCVQFG